jgi:23S rRNA (guanine2445-N2)-methyltransferase
MFTYQKNHRFFAQVADGLEEAGSKELENIGASEVKPSYRGVYFSADIETLYRINYRSSLCTRILAPLLTFDCHSDKYLYKTAGSIPWSEILSLEKTFAIFANVSNSNITHSQYAARKLKDAIVDQFRDSCGKRPDVDPDYPDVWINLHIQGNRATISLDTSGGSLHRRGYRKASVTAPMQETVAAAIIKFSQWDGTRPLYDPFCGSGTLLAEALIHQCRIPAGYLRDGFGFDQMPEFDMEVWKKVRDECDQEIEILPEELIGGSDASSKAAAAAKKNCRMLQGGQNIEIKTRKFQDLDGIENSVIVCNPPYGIRLETEKGAQELLEEFGVFLKEKCKGSVAFVYLGKESLLKQVPLWPSWKKPLNNGGLQGVLARYKIR